jgi:hypothetical protein
VQGLNRGDCHARSLEQQYFLALPAHLQAHESDFRTDVIQ